MLPTPSWSSGVDLDGSNRRYLFACFRVLRTHMLYSSHKLKYVALQLYTLLSLLFHKKV